MDFTPLIEAMKIPQTEDAQAMSAYLKHQFPFIGLKSVDRRTITKPYFKEAKQEARIKYKEDPEAILIDWAFVNLCWQQEEREFQYIAADYIQAMQSYLKKEDITHLKKLIITKSWWDSVDALVKRVGYLAKQYPELKATLLEWSESDNIWLKRTSIINQLNMKEETDTDLLKQAIINNLGSKEFFVNKAIGWALRDYAKTNEVWVREFLQTYEPALSPLSLREATKHIEIN